METNITTAEDQLLYLLRGKDADNFTLKILFSDGCWTIELSTFEPALTGIGQGKSFAEAWDAIVDPRMPKHPVRDGDV